MNDKKLKIKYNGTKFTLHPKEAIIIEWYKIVLFFVRQWRRFIQRLGYLHNILYLILLWLLFLLGVYIWAQSYMQNYSINDLLWDMKYSFFTSVIITGFVAFSSNLQKHHRIFSKQFDTYIDMLYASDNLGIAVLNCSSGKKHIDYHEHYDMMFFTADRLHRVIIQLKCQQFDLPENYPALKKAVIQIQKQLTEIKSLNSNQLIMYCSEKRISEKVRKLDDEAKTICELCDNQKIDKDRMIEFEYKILNIIDDIRVPWRKDYNINQNIRRILLNNDPLTVMDEFYMCLFLNIINYDDSFDYQ